MKKYFFISIYAFIVIACDSSESEVETLENSFLRLEARSEPPFNASNLFDIAGAVHNELLYDYHDSIFLPYSLDSIANRVNVKAKNHPFFENLETQDFSMVPNSRIEELVFQGRSIFPSLINELSLSIPVKAEFEWFITSILNKIDADAGYTDIYTTVVAYETSLENNTLYTVEERAYILTVTTIIRHSVHVKEKRPKKNTDPDWDWLTANVFGAVEGARYGMPSAITTALKAGIKENRQ